MSSSTRTIIIDDTDTGRINYSGAWVNRTNSQEYGGGSRGSATAGASATLKFTGSSIQVIGTIPEEGEEEDDSDQQVVVHFSLDSVPCPSYTRNLPQEEDLLWQTVLQQDVAEGEHTLVISLNTTSPSPTFYLDYITIVTSSQSLDKNDLIYVDDGDPLITYDAGSWTSGGSPTTHRTRDSTSRVSFKFNGTYVNVIGSASNSGTQVTLDGSTTTVKSSSSHAISESIYEKNGLSDSEHTLVLSATSNDEMSLDYIVYRPSSRPGGQNQGNGSNNGGDENLGSDGNSGPRSGGARLSGGAIAGVVIGVILGLGLLVLAAVWFVRRSRRRHIELPRSEKKRKDMQFSVGSHTRGTSGSHTPFLEPAHSSAPYSDSPVSPLSSSDRNPALPYPASQYTSEVGSSTAPMTASSDLAKVGHSQPVVLSWSTPAPVMHEDAGVRLDGERDDQYREEFPPAYRPYYPSRDEH